MNGRRGGELYVNPKTIAGRDINTGFSARNETDKDCEVRKLISVYANISCEQTAPRDSIIKFLEKKRLMSNMAAFLLRKKKLLTSSE